MKSKKVCLKATLILSFRWIYRSNGGGSNFKSEFNIFSVLFCTVAEALHIFYYPTLLFFEYNMFNVQCFKLDTKPSMIYIVYIICFTQVTESS